MSDSEEDSYLGDHQYSFIYQALADLTIKETEQDIDTSRFEDAKRMSGAEMRYMVDFIHRNLRHVTSLSFRLRNHVSEEWRDVSDKAVNVLRKYLRQTALQKIGLCDAYLGNNQGARLLSGLHGVTFVRELTLSNLGLRGRTGGATISALLQSMPCLKRLGCRYNPLGVRGARALQPGIRTNTTVEELDLQGCSIRSEGLLAVVDALVEGNKTSAVKVLGLDGNRIRANGIPHLIRLLQQHRSSSVTKLDLDSNPGMFENEERTALLVNALQQKSELNCLRLNSCRLPGYAVVALLQALVVNKAPLLQLFAYDRDVQLQGQDLERLLETIPMIKLRSLSMNLDFTNKAVLSSFCSNTSIEYLYDENSDEIAAGPVVRIMERNYRLRRATELLFPGAEFQQIITPLGLWAKGIAKIVDDQSGTSGAYKILQEKLAMFVAPEASVASPAAATAAVPSFHNTAVKRSPAQTSRESDIEETEEGSLSLLLEPQQKRPRLYLLPPPSMSHDKKSPSSTAAATPTTMPMETDTTNNIGSLSREELLELIEQMKQTIAEQDATILAQAGTIATLVKKNTGRVEGGEEEDDQHMSGGTPVTL
jgi:Ran GTPase-activating protein (RanGAP) involved in mRNA processing and transport